MPENKKQLIRLIKLVAELKENRYPNCHSFAEKLRKSDIDGNMNVSCKAKTIQRDIRTLKDDFDAPIEFDFRNNGFYLAHHGWNFVCPSLQDEDMMASVFGAKVAEDIFPEPVKSQIRKAVDTQLAGNNPDFLDTAFIKTLIVASGAKTEIDPRIFSTVFSAWQGRRAIDIGYRAPDGSMSKRRVEPHVLTYFNNAWYIKGFCLKSNATRIFAVHRITSAEITEKSFEPDRKIIDSVIEGDVFDYGKVKDVEIWLAPESANYARERKLRKGEKLAFNKDGSAVLHLPGPVEIELIEEELLATDSVRIRQSACGLLTENLQSPGVVAWLADNYQRLQPDVRQMVFYACVKLNTEESADLACRLLEQGHKPDDGFLRALSGLLEKEPDNQTSYLKRVEQTVRAKPELAARLERVKEKMAQVRARYASMRQEYEPISREFIGKARELLNKYNVPAEKQEQFFKTVTNLEQFGVQNAAEADRK